MSDTPTNRAYAWALQTDFLTQKAIAAGALKKLIVTDQNFIDYEPQTANDEEWSHGVNSATDEWVEAHQCQVSHTMPGHSQEMGKVFYLNMSDYSISTPVGGTTSKAHKFKPTNPNVTRQNKAVTYAEKFAQGWNVLMPRTVSDGFTLNADGKGVLTLDFNLLGAGLVISNSGVTWSGGTPTVTAPTGLHKFFNTQVGLTVTDAGTPTVYGCRYRSAQLAYKMTMLTEAGYKPGCAEFLTANDPTSGQIMSAHEFDKQMLDFTIVVDMATSSPEFAAVQQQKPLSLVVTATAGIIETTIRHKLTVTVPVAKYKTSKPTVTNGIATFTITGKALFDFVTDKLFEIELINDVTSYATAW